MFFLRAINDQVWDTVVEGYSDPIVIVDSQTVKKPRAQWTAYEKTKSNYNNKAINAIYNGITSAEFHRIFACPTAKAARDLLQTIHEGASTVKQTKLQNLTIAFETIKMKDSETFDEFNIKLSIIINSSFNMGEPIPQSKNH